MHCRDWQLGIGASLRCGLAALGPGVEAAVVCLADGPNLSPEAVRRVLKTTVDDLNELAFVGTHGAFASGMQSVAFTPATAIASAMRARGSENARPRAIATVARHAIASMAGRFAHA